MKYTILSSVFFLISWIGLVSGTLVYKKSEQKLVGMLWIPLAILLSTCYHTLGAAVLNLLNLPVNIVSIGILDVFMALLIWFQVIRKKEIQQYKFAVIDIFYGIALVGVVAVLALKHYGGLDLYINYSTVDPAVHLQAAVDVVLNQCVNNMFYSALFNGLLIEVFAPFVKLDYYYQIFVLGDIINFALAGLMFYGVIRGILKNKYTTVAGLIVSFMYLLGYPLCSTLFGFVYLGMGVTIVAMIIALADLYEKEEINKYLNLVLMMLACFALFECYVLFVPVVFFALISFVFAKQWKKRGLVSLDTVVTCLIIFLIPCILGFIFTYKGIFNGGVTVASAISAEGACYRDLYSNFLPFMPLAIFGWLARIKNRENGMINFIMPFAAMFSLYLFMQGMQGKVSSYYFYKTYNLLWLIVFILVVYGISYLEKQTKILVGIIFLVWCFVAWIYMNKIDSRIQDKNVLFNPTNKSVALNDLYSFNGSTLLAPGYSLDKRKLYHYAYDELLQKGVDIVAISCYVEDAVWFQAITYQRLYGWDYLSPDHTAYYDKLNASGAEYLVVLYDGDLYKDNPDYYDDFEILYKNPAGFVAKIKE